MTDNTETKKFRTVTLPAGASTEEIVAAVGDSKHVGSQIDPDDSSQRIHFLDEGAETAVDAASEELKAESTEVTLTETPAAAEQRKGKQPAKQEVQE